MVDGIASCPTSRGISRRVVNATPHSTLFHASPLNSTPSPPPLFSTLLLLLPLLLRRPSCSSFYSYLDPPPPPPPTPTPPAATGTDSIFRSTAPRPHAARMPGRLARLWCGRSWEVVGRWPPRARGTRRPPQRRRWLRVVVAAQGIVRVTVEVLAVVLAHRLQSHEAAAAPSPSSSKLRLQWRGCSVIAWRQPILSPLRRHRPALMHHPLPAVAPAPALAPTAMLLCSKCKLGRRCRLPCRLLPASSAATPQACGVTVRSSSSCCS